MFFVAGITGRVGGAAAQHLLDGGHMVRALVRDAEKADEWSQKGVDVRQGDLSDAKALAEGIEGVEGAFVMQPTPVIVEPSLALANAITAGVREALDRRPPPRLVVLSSVGSEQTSGLGNITQTHLLEEALDDLSFPIAFIRAGAFIENLVGGLKPAASTGWFDSFLQPMDHAFPMVATADIGREVARLLVDGWTGRKILELGSRTRPDEIAYAMGEVLGREVQARAIPREQWIATLEGMGLPKGKTALWEEMQDGFNSGWIDFGVPGTEAVAGTTTPSQVFAAARKF